MPGPKRSRAAAEIGLPGRGPGRKPAAPPSATGLLTELTALGQKIAAHALRAQIGEVVTQARATLNFLQAGPVDAPEWREYVYDCLVSVVETARPFAERCSHLTEPTDPAVSRFQQFLTAHSHTLGNLHAKLTAEPRTETAGLDAYRSTLRHISRTLGSQGHHGTPPKGV